MSLLYISFSSHDYMRKGQNDPNQILYTPSVFRYFSFLKFNVTLANLLISLNL